MKQQDTSNAANTSSDGTSIDWSKYPIQPYEFQKEVVEQTYAKPYWALFMEMGCGKSFMLIATICELYLEGKVDTVLYVAKKGEVANFQTYELSKLKPANVECTAWVYTGYQRKDEVMKIKHMLAPKNHLRVLSMNIESLRGGYGFEIAKAYLRSSRKTLIIVDESTTLKDHRSAQHKAMKLLRGYAKYARIATGTVMPHNPTDVFCQSLFLDKHAMGYGGVTAFRSEFCEMEKTFLGSRMFMTQVGVKNLDRLSDKMRRFGTVAKKVDLLDLPEKVYKRHRVDLTDEQKRIYQDFVDYHVAKIEGDYIECKNGLSLMLRLHQIVCGQIVTPEREYVRIPNNRYETTKLILDEVLENEAKVVVWSHFREATAGLVEYLERDYGLVFLRAGLGIAERSELIDSFKTDPSKRIFLGNPQSSGFGLTLTEAHTTVYYSNSDNYEHRLQSEDRIHRIGQSDKCLYIDLHSPGTVEDSILDRTVMKAMNREGVMKTDEFIKLLMLRQ